MYIFTDAIGEAADSNEEEFGKDRRRETLMEVEDRPLGEGVTVLLERVERWCGEKGLDDDVSILALEVNRECE